MKAATKRSVICLALLAMGYALGSYNGAASNWTMSIAVLLLFLAAVVLAKLGAWLFMRTGRSGPGRAGNGPFPMVPRPPGGKPPVLTARELLP